LTFHKKIAEAEHDTDKVRAKDEVYKAHPPAAMTNLPRAAKPGRL